MVAAAALMLASHRVTSSADKVRMAGCYRVLVDPLRSFLARRTRSIHDAEDLTQEVFLRMWRMRTSNEIRHLGAFAFKTANNLLRDRSRRAYSRVMRTAVTSAMPNVGDCDTEPSGVLECAQTFALFNATLLRLRPSTRKAFLMYRVDICPQAEVAAEMGISVSMVEKHINCAMTALRQAGIYS